MILKTEPAHEQLAKMLVDIELIIFDIDGTILKDTHLQYWKHLNIALALHKDKTWRDDDFKYYLRTNGYTTRQHIMASMLDEDASQQSELVQRAMDSFYESFCQDREKSELYPNVIGAISELSRNGIPSIAFSDTEEILIKKMLADHNLHGYFEEIVGEAKKPDPQKLHHTLSRRASSQRLAGNHILVIGDNLKTDGALAEKAGCSFLYFSGGDENKRVNFLLDIDSGSIPKDSLMINNHGEIIDAIDALLALREERTFVCK